MTAFKFSNCVIITRKLRCVALPLCGCLLTVTTDKSEERDEVSKLKIAVESTLLEISESEGRSQSNYMNEVMLCALVEHTRK